MSYGNKYQPIYVRNEDESQWYLKETNTIIENHQQVALNTVAGAENKTNMIYIDVGIARKIMLLDTGAEINIVTEKVAQEIVQKTPENAKRVNDKVCHTITYANKSSETTN